MQVNFASFVFKSIRGGLLQHSYLEIPVALSDLNDMFPFSKYQKMSVFLALNL